MEDGLVVTLGDQRYRIERPWGRLPPGVGLGLVSQVAVDSADRVYVFQRGEPPVLVFELKRQARSSRPSPMVGSQTRTASRCPPTIACSWSTATRIRS